MCWVLSCLVVTNHIYFVDIILILFSSLLLGPNSMKLCFHKVAVPAQKSASSETGLSTVLPFSSLQLTLQIHCFRGLKQSQAISFSELFIFLLRLSLPPDGPEDWTIRSEEMD
jgi:hypothetical protein